MTGAASRPTVLKQFVPQHPYDGHDFTITRWVASALPQFERKGLGRFVMTSLVLEAARRGYQFAALVLDRNVGEGMRKFLSNELRFEISSKTVLSGDVDPPVPVNYTTVRLKENCAQFLTVKSSLLSRLRSNGFAVECD